jgi:hypothetical protein
VSETPQRLDNVRRSARLGRWLALAATLSILMVGIDLVIWGANKSAIPNLVSVTVMAAAAFLGAQIIFMRDLVDLILKVEATHFRMYDVLRDIQNSQNAGEKHLQIIAENSRLSEVARSITYRDNERNALRLAINEEIIRGDYEAAYALVEQLEARHGYRNEAARIRQEVDLSSDREKNEKVHEAVQRCEELMSRLEWDRARRDMDRLLVEFPASPDIRELPKLFARRRGEHKRRLLKEWDLSVQRNEVDRGIALLKQLDQYLTPNEAAALEESARGVFRAKLHNLGVQFSLAVTEHNWRDALEAGKQIIEEFPNTRMAREVTERMDVLNRRAADGTESEPEPMELGLPQAS